MNYLNDNFIRVKLLKKSVLILVTFFCLCLPARSEDIRLGLVGCDTSHATAFTALLNDTKNPKHIPGAKVVVAMKWGSPDLEASSSRIDKIAEELASKHGVKLVQSTADLLNQVDAVLIESVDGRVHLEQARQIIPSGKPVFIDKPLSGSLRDAYLIYMLAKQHKTPCFSSSAYRYYESLVTLKNTQVGDIRGVISYGPCHFEPHHPDLYWYGIHSVEALFTILGTGCESVVRTSSPDIDVVTGTWSLGRVGSVYGLRTGATPHKVTVFGSKKVAEQNGSGDYAPLVREIVKFVQTKTPPITLEETLEIMAFMEAADESKRHGGTPVKIADVIKKNYPEIEK